MPNYYFIDDFGGVFVGKINPYALALL